MSFIRKTDKLTKAEAKEVKTLETLAAPATPWEQERAAAAKALASLNDGGWNALREVLRRNGFAKLYEGA